MVSKLTLQYDGAGFAGWAAQPGLRTVQAEVERALRTILGERIRPGDADRPGAADRLAAGRVLTADPGADGAEDRLALTVAGRTDRGVHAWAQVASYRHEAVDPLRLNALLPDDISILASEPASERFDARRDARSRTYCYRVLARRSRDVFERGRALWWPRPLDRDALAACAALLPGTHDFTAFTPTETDHVRFERDVRRAEWRERADVLELWIEADTFMRHMNRVLVGTMIEVASGRRSVEQFGALLDGAPRSAAGPTAPAHGLALAAVAY